MSAFFEVTDHQRACRAFTVDPVSDELVARVLVAATHAPSAENAQPWVFVVVRDPSIRAAIGDLTRKRWEGGARQHSEGRLSPGLLDEVDKGATGGVASAPVVVVVGADTTRVHPSALEASLFPAIQNFLLAASALGLGSVLTTLPTTGGSALSETVGLPDHVRPVAVLPLGWPERPGGLPRRRPLDEVAHRDRFGTPW